MIKIYMCLAFSAICFFSYITARYDWPTRGAGVAFLFAMTIVLSSLVSYWIHTAE